MKKIVIEFMFSSSIFYEDFIGSLDSWIADFMDSGMSDDLTYKILEE